MKKLGWIFILIGFSFLALAKTGENDSKGNTGAVSSSVSNNGATTSATNGDPNTEHVETGGMHTPPTGQKLDADMNVCKGESCDKENLSASALSEPSCSLGANVFNGEGCGKGSTKSGRSGTSQSQDGNE